MAGTQATVARTVAHEPHPDLPPPRTSVGMLGWLRANLFSSVPNGIITLLCAGLIVYLLPPFLEWAVIKAHWSGASRAACPRDGGACWVYIHAWFERFIYGLTFPLGQAWRVNLTFALLALAIAMYFVKAFRWKGWLSVFLIFGYPVIAFILLRGGVWHLSDVPTGRWGGLTLTLVVSLVGIVGSLPLGIVLALGRRSRMPVIKVLSTVFIELWRGVPLITVLFMASVMIPLFLPDGVTFDKLLRVLIGVTLFSAAYMAEVVRGGLQAIPKGQGEAAAALGLSYWKTMGFIVLPQALKLVIPGIVNTFIGLFKDTTLVLIIGLFDLLGSVQAANTNPKWLGFSTEGYVFAAAVFWVFCFSMSRYSQWLERRLHTGHRGR